MSWELKKDEILFLMVNYPINKAAAFDLLGLLIGNINVMRLKKIPTHTIQSSNFPTKMNKTDMLF